MASVASSGGLNQMCQAVYDRLKCERCGSRLRAGKYRWYKCSGAANHQVCQDCTEVQKIKNCSCGKLIFKEHCAMTEGLLKADTMSFKCTNESRGCNEIYGEKAMKEHEEDCIFRLVTCPMNCEVQFHELLKHVDDHHDVKEMSIPKDGKCSATLHLSVIKEGFYMQPLIVKFDKNAFIFDGILLKDHQPWMFTCWVQLVGSQMEANNYCYTLEFHGTNQNTLTTFSAVSSSINATKETKLLNDCFAYGGKVFMKQFADENDNFKISISMRNLKEEAMDDNEESGISDNE